MILTNNSIINNIKSGKISITPFDINHVTTNSYDLKLFDELVFYTDEILDPKKKLNYQIIKIPKSGFKLEAKKFYLASSFEKLGSDFFVPIIHAKSGIARLGLFVHVTADLIDIGYNGRITFQLYPINDIIIYPNMKIAQVTFWKPFGKIKLYNGKYQNSKKPTTSKIFKDFK